MNTRPTPAYDYEAIPVGELPSRFTVLAARATLAVLRFVRRTAIVTVTAIVAVSIGVLATIAAYGRPLPATASAPVPATSGAAVLTVSAAPTACVPTYAHGAWNVCGVVFPASAEDNYAATYDLASHTWQLVPTTDH